MNTGYGGAVKVAALTAAGVIHTDPPAGGTKLRHWLPRHRLMVREAVTLADADRSVVIREPDVRRGVALAGAWLREQPGAGEVVVLSDFQVGALSDADFDALPAWGNERASLWDMFERAVAAGFHPKLPDEGIIYVP